MREKVDFSVCEFIDENMWFFTYADFCENRAIIKRMFDSLKYPGKKFYMWYVYANVHTSEQQKNKIWNYLNGYDYNGEELLQALEFYKHKR